MKLLHLVFILAVQLALVQPLQAADAISIRADEWFPFNGKPGSDKPGYGIEIFKAVFEKAGRKVDYALMPWKRAIDEGSKGSHNAIIGAYKSDAPDYVFPDEPIGHVSNGFFMKKGGKTWKYEGVASLDKVVLGAINSYSYEPEVDAYIEKNKGDAKKLDLSSGENALDSMVKKLNMGRMDVAIEVPAVFYAKVEELGLKKDDFIQAGVSHDPEPIYVAFSPAKPSSKADAELFSKAVDEMRKSGELKKILDKYGIADWKK